MTSDWNQSAQDRKDFRHGKGNDRVEKPTPKNTGSRKAKKSVVLQYKTKTNMFGWGGNWSPWKKYRTREVAVEAWKRQLRTTWYSHAEWRIKGEKYNLSLETEKQREDDARTS